MIGVVRTILIDLCVVCSCLILSGCSWIYDNHYCCEINEEEGSFDVFSDWHECPDADPAGMAYMFFPFREESRGVSISLRKMAVR